MKFKKIAYYIVIGMMMVLALKTVMAQIEPTPPDTLLINGSGRHGVSSSGVPIVAQAGNVTALEIYETTVSQFWQGYYGNVSGTIVLDDANNDSIFAWELARPQGEIYAANGSGSINWNNLTCVNLTQEASPVNNSISQLVNLSTLMVQYNMNGSAVTTVNASRESFNYTFNDTFDGSFDVAQHTVQSTDDVTCSQVTTFVDDDYQTTAFKEVLVHDNESQLIFVAILENDLSGYRTGSDDTHDFQMLVAEDGSPGQEDSTTTYYFYVELE